MNKPIAPHIRTESTAGKMVFDVLLAAVPLGVFAYVNYGMRPIYMILLTVLSAIVSEMLCCLVRRHPIKAALDGTAAITGLLIALVMSPMAPYWMPMLGAAFAIIVVKAPFGGVGRNVFNPAAAGIAVLTVFFPVRMFSYPALTGSLNLPTGLSAGSSIVTEPSLASQLQNGAPPTQTSLQLLLGDFTGPIGTTAIAILLAFGCYLLVRRTASPWIMLPYLGTCLLWSLVYPMTGMSVEQSVLAQMCSGYVVFAGVFLINDPVTAPRFWLGRLFYGVLTALLVMALQRHGSVEAGSCFAILIMNAVSPIIDRWSWHGWHWLHQRRRIRREVKAYE